MGCKCWLGLMGIGGNMNGKCGRRRVGWGKIKKKSVDEKICFIITYDKKNLIFRQMKDDGDWFRHKSFRNDLQFLEKP